MSMVKPLVSVIIPVFNRPDELKRAIQSVICQTFQNFEILVIDDGSDENLEIICNEFHDPRIRYYRNDIHINANVARNTGIRNAKGEYIAMLDADDEFLPHHLERRIQKIQEWKCDGIIGSAYFFDGKNQKIRLSRPIEDNELMINYLLSYGFAPTPSHFFKKDAALDVLWDESLERHQDYDFTVRFSEKYKILSDYQPSIRIHLSQRVIGKSELDSCIKFIKSQERSISRKIYCDYHRNMYLSIANTKYKKYLKHYSQNSYKYIFHVSLSNFLAVHQQSRKFAALLFVKYVYIHLKNIVKMLLGSNLYTTN